MRALLDTHYLIWSMYDSRRLPADLIELLNNRILDRVFRLGVTNAKTQKDYQGVDLNLNLGQSARYLKDMVPAKKYVDIHGDDQADTWGLVAPSAGAGTSVDNGSNFMYAQRRIMSRMLAAANLIASVSRRGRGQWAVMSAKTLSALQDNAAFVVAPMVNTLTVVNCFQKLVSLPFETTNAEVKIR